MTMLKLTIAIIALSTAATAAPSAPSLPRRFACEQVGTWACNPPPEGICVDGPLGKGRRYKFDVARRTFATPEGKGRILAIVDSEDDGSILSLSNETELRYDPDQKTRSGEVAVWLTPVPTPNKPYGAPALFCKP